MMQHLLDVAKHHEYQLMGKRLNPPPAFGLPQTQMMPGNHHLRNPTCVDSPHAALPARVAPPPGLQNFAHPHNHAKIGTALQQQASSVFPSQPPCSRINHPFNIVAVPPAAESSNSKMDWNFGNVPPHSSWTSQGYVGIGNAGVFSPPNTSPKHSKVDNSLLWSPEEEAVEKCGLRGIFDEDSLMFKTTSQKLGISPHHNTDIWNGPIDQIDKIDIWGLKS